MLKKKCDECFKMRDHIAVLVSELKSAQLIIKLLQEDAKYECSNTVSQANLATCVNYNHSNEHTAPSGSNSMWKEVRRSKHSSSSPKRSIHNFELQNSYPAWNGNRFEPLSEYQPQGPKLSGTRTSHTRIQTVRSNALSKRRIVILGDS